jgi:hypothetical protein
MFCFSLHFKFWLNNRRYFALHFAKAHIKMYEKTDTVGLEKGVIRAGYNKIGVHKTKHFFSA